MGRDEKGIPAFNLSYYFNQLVIFCEDDMQPSFSKKTADVPENIELGKVPESFSDH
jgi:hypothetical protein